MKTETEVAYVVKVSQAIPETTLPDLISPPLQLPALKDGDHYRFHVTLKPSGSQCNLDCAYCF